MIHTRLEGLVGDTERIARVAVAAYDLASLTSTEPSGTASYDNGDGTRTVIGPQAGGRTIATHVGDLTPPGRPLGVAGASSAGVVYIAWCGELEGGVPDDFDHVSLYMSVEGTSELVGTLTEAGIVSTVPMATTATVEVWATAEDDACIADGTPAHNISSESDHATVKVTQAEDKAAVDALRDRLSKVEATADGLSTLIREGEDGITVGKSADGKTWSTMRTRMGTSAFEVLTKAGEVASSFGESLIELGKNSVSSAIKMCGGSLLIQTRKVSGSPYVDGLTWIGNVSDRSSVTMRGGAAVGLTIGGSEDERSDVWMGLQHAEAGALDSPPVSIVTGVERHSVSAATVSVSADSVEVSNQAMTSSVTVPMSRLATLLSDTGWTWFANYGGGHGVRWRCVAGVVYVQAAIYGEHTVGTGGWDAGTIPASYRPSSDVAAAGVSFGALTNPTQLRAGSNGNVNLWAPSNTNFFGGLLSYPLEA